MASNQLTAGGGPAAGGRRNTRRGRRSRRRGRRGGVRWRARGEERTDELYIAQLNVQSLKSKLPDLRHNLAEVHHFDIIALSETWLRPSVPNRLLNVDGYQLIRHDLPANSRLPKYYGGVAMLARDSFDVTVLKLPSLAFSSLISRSFGPWYELLEVGT